MLVPTAVRKWPSTPLQPWHRTLDQRSKLRPGAVIAAAHSCSGVRTTPLATLCAIFLIKTHLLSLQGKLTAVVQGLTGTSPHCMPQIQRAPPLASHYAYPCTNAAGFGTNVFRRHAAGLEANRHFVQNNVRACFVTALNTQSPTLFRTEKFDDALSRSS